MASLPTSLRAITSSKAPNQVCLKATGAPDATTLCTDIVIVFDKSGSMSEPANDKNPELTCFSKADIAKHAASMMAMGSKTLAIVTFSDSAVELMPPTRMDEAGKKLALERIDAINANGCTALWEGIQKGYTIAPEGATLVVLTDGLPTTTDAETLVKNYKKLSEQMPKNIRVVTMGFGSGVNSELLNLLSPVNYFISDGTMVLNSFTHFMANEDIRMGKATVSMGLGCQPLGSLGELRVGQALVNIVDVNASGTFSMDVNGITVATALAERDDEAFAKAQARVTAMNAIQNAITIGHLSLTKAKERILAVVEQTEALSPGLIKDLVGEVSLALSPENWSQWGPHYLRALLSAHANQTCVNLKDAGPLEYASEAFLKRKDELFALCATLPTPQGTRATSHPRAPMAAADFQHFFMTAEGGCFGDERVATDDGRSKRVSDLNKGDVLRNGARVVCVVVYDEPTKVLIVDGVALTERHPVVKNGQWVHPIDLTNTESRIEPTVYNLVLGGDSDGTISFVNDDGDAILNACVLAHGLVGPIVGHDYLGTDAVVRDLEKLPGWTDGMVTLKATNVRRNAMGICAYVAA